MLTELRLENFKCFESEVVIPMARLNLLTGINAKGKSTTLQAILVLHQSIDRALSGALVLDRIELNGRYVRLGNLRELRHRDRPKDESVQIGLELSDGKTRMTRLYLKQDDEARWARIGKMDLEVLSGSELELEKSLPATGDEPFVSLDFRAPDSPARASGLEQLGRVHYVSADRLGPQDFFPWSNEAGFFSVGVHGERTAEVLYQAGKEQYRIEDVRARAESDTQLVTDQASAWLSYLFDGGKVRVEAPHSTILTLEMNADGSAHYHRPMNVGFGYSYALPILVAGLVARSGEILIVENPEAHLHPLAQSRLGEFLAIVSRAGVQVFVESHSEHILNAFRLAVKEHLLTEDDLRVLYFRRHEVEPVVRVVVGADGRVQHWPDGFFDQRTRDLFSLFGE